MATRVGTPRMTCRSRQLVITLTTKERLRLDDEGGGMASAVPPFFVLGIGG